MRPPEVGIDTAGEHAARGPLASFRVVTLRGVTYHPHQERCGLSLTTNDGEVLRLDLSATDVATLAQYVETMREPAVRARWVAEGRALIAAAVPVFQRGPCARQSERSSDSLSAEGSPNDGHVE